MGFSDDVTLKYDVVVHPSKSKGDKYLIVCHGFGDARIEFEEYEFLFSELVNDYSIVSFTFSKCDKKIYKVNSILEWVNNLEDVVSWIKSMNSKARITLFGISMGAWVTTLYCCRNTSVCKNICVGPVFTLHTGMKSSGGVALLFAQNKQLIELNGILVNRNFLESLINNQPINQIIQGKYITPTIMYVGGLDNIYRKTDVIMVESLLKEREVECASKVIRTGRHFINNVGAIEELTQHLKCII